MCIKCWNRSLTLTQSVALAALSVWFSFGGQSEVPSSVACPSIFLLDYQPTATFSLEPAPRRQPVLLGDAWHRCRPSEVYKYTLCCVCQQGTKVSPSASTSFVFFCFFLPCSALPPPVDLLTNTRDYVTLRCGTLPTCWTGHTSRASRADSTRLSTHLGTFGSPKTPATGRGIKPPPILFTSTKRRSSVGAL